MTIQETQVLQGTKLNQVATETATAHEVALSLAGRQRLRHFSDVNRMRVNLIRSGKQIVEKDYMTFWQGLEGMGIGTLIYPRSKNKPVRFEWHYSLKAVSKAMVEGVDQAADKIVFAKPKAKAAPKAAKTEVKTQKRRGRPRLNKEFSQLKVMVLLRAGRQAQLDIPSDFNEKEADKICKALKKASAA